MPYYIHLASTSAEAIRESLEDPTRGFPPGDSLDARGCGCSACKNDAWRDYWSAHPDIPYGQKPLDETNGAPLVLATFTTAGEAHTAKKSLQSSEPLAVSFIPTNQEREDWRARERRKVMRSYGSGCVDVPWRHEDWYALSDGETKPALADMHNAYLSVAKPGLIAYTPSEEFGVADRQMAVRPGRYLEQFAPHLSSAERDALCAKVKAVDDRNVVRFATTPEDIEKVYRNGPDSCMSHSVSSYATGGIHPVTAYGNSDLHLAYLANEDGRTFRARALVWPEKKIYSRVYGDETIKYLLATLGYKSGSLAGAHIRAIRISRGAYVMPYIDGIATADLVSGNRFRLCGEDDDDGDYRTQDTNGTTDEDRQNDEDDAPQMCAHCENETNGDSAYCDTCEDERHSCVRCDSEFFDDSPYEIDNYGVLCNRCHSRYTQACDECCERFCEDAYGTYETSDREAQDLTNFCLACGRDVLERRQEEQAEREALEEEERKAQALRDEMADMLQHAMNTRGIATRFIIGIEVSR